MTKAVLSDGFLICLFSQQQHFHQADPLGLGHLGLELALDLINLILRLKKKKFLSLRKKMKITVKSQKIYNY